MKKQRKWKQKCLRRILFPGKKWILPILALATVLATFETLSLPALTQSQPVCGLQEHLHTQDCYAQTLRTQYECENLSVHEHTDSCQSQDGLQCQSAAYILHEHDSYCYDGSQNITCFLEEILADDQGHLHEDACWDETGLVCPQKSLPAHEHGLSCYEQGVLVCLQPQIQSHQHTEACCSQSEVSILNCQIQEHTHEAGCYQSSDKENENEYKDSINNGNSTDTIQDPGLNGQSPALTSESPDESQEDLDALTESGCFKEGVLMADPYVTDVQFFYRKEGEEDWIGTSDFRKVPGNARIRMAVIFEGVSATDLIAHDGQLHMDIPSWMKNPTPSGSIVIDGTSRGSVSIYEGRACYNLDAEWLASYMEQTGSLELSFDGYFYVESELDLQSTDGQEMVVILGDIVKHLYFDEDLLENYGAVSIEKTITSGSQVIEENGQSYLEYTLKVTAGENGSQNVTVTDTFTSNGKYILGYAGVSQEARFLTGNTDPAAAPVEGHPEDSSLTYGTVQIQGTQANPGLVWTIGNMKPKEVRTLTYRVLLKEDYTGDAIRGSLVNEATVKPDTPVEKTSSATFTPSAMVYPVKSLLSTTEEEDGSLTLTYQIQVIAASTSGVNNSYTLKDVFIKDGFFLESGYRTDEKLLPYITIDMDSFQGDFEETPVYIDSIKGFTIQMGDMAPGQRKTFTFSVRVDPGIYAAAGLEDVIIWNRAWSQSVNQLTGKDILWNRYYNRKNLSHKQWSRKLEPEYQQDAILQILEGDVWKQDAQGVWQKDAKSSFEIAMGSYKYEVIVNETGNWDMNQTVFSDVLSGPAAYSGYAHIQVYDCQELAAGTVLSTDSQALAFLESQSPYASVWLNIDGFTEFSFCPADLNLPQGSYAYRITYYADPQLPSGIPTAQVTNTFSLTGNTVYGQTVYETLSAVISVSTKVQGDDHLFVNKEGWYYQQPDEEEEFSNGKLYWIIRVETTLDLESGDLTILDTPSSSPAHSFLQGSLAGAWLGSSQPALSISSCVDYAQFLLDNDRLQEYTKLSDLAFSLEIGKDGTASITNRQALSIPEGQALYLIVCTQPGQGTLPTASRGAITYKNSLATQIGQSEIVDWSPASLEVLPGGKVFKELGSVFEIRDGVFNRLQGSRNSWYSGMNLDGQSLSLENGTYIDWSIQINHEGNLSGTFYLLDTLPYGTELSYMALSWAGSGYAALADKVYTEEIEGLEEQGWTRHTIIAYTSSAATTGSRPVTIYYTKDNQIFMKVVQVQKADAKDQGALQFQCIVKVTDPDALLGSEIKEFTNRVSLLDASQRELSHAFSEVSLTVSTITKEGLYTAEMGALYPFEIEVNSLGCILNPEGNGKLVIIDEISETLKVDYDTLIATDQRTGQEVDIQVQSLSGNRMRLVVPDGIPLSITYTAKVNAPPESHTAISNVAYWEGYPPEDSTIVEDYDFSYVIGGGGSLNAVPLLIVEKQDQSDMTGASLAGAEFDVYTTEMENGVRVLKERVSSVVTSQSGTAMLSLLEDGSLIQYNTVYALVETKAPQGYVLDSSPWFFAFAQADGQGQYPQWEAEVQAVYDQNTLKAEIPNGKGSLEIVKTFQSSLGKSTIVPGEYAFGLYESPNPDESSNPLQTVILEIAQDGSGSTGLFENLDLDKPYWVYELDQEGNPIVSGQSGLIGGLSYKVLSSLENDPVLLEQDQPEKTVQLCNVLQYAALPNTGGPGKRILWQGAAALMALGGAGQYVFDKKYRKANGKETKQQ